jgi:hypothetical protein
MGDDTWEWSFDFTFDNVDYVCTLTGTRMNDEEFSVEMVTAEAPTPSLKSLWLDGVARYDHTSAFWTLYEEGNQAALEIEWNKDLETEEADLTYTYVKPDQAETGSFISWTYHPEEIYDATYSISMSDNTTHIEWNLSTIEGRVKSPAFFGDDNWYCWDSYANGLADIDCD